MQGSRELFLQSSERHKIAYLFSLSFCLPGCLLSLPLTQCCSLWLSQSAMYITLLQCVFVSPQPGALTILLWQWNSDDEPCVQGSLPQGQPHTNRQRICTSIQTHTQTHSHKHSNTESASTTYWFKPISISYKWLLQLNSEGPRHLMTLFTPSGLLKSLVHSSIWIKSTCFWHKPSELQMLLKHQPVFQPAENLMI